MSRRGNGYDNAVVESFFGMLRQELVHGSCLATIVEARAAIRDNIAVFCNRRRPRSALEYRAQPVVDELTACWPRCDFHRS